MALIFLAVLFCVPNGTYSFELIGQYKARRLAGLRQRYGLIEDGEDDADR